MAVNLTNAIYNLKLSSEKLARSSNATIISGKSFDVPTNYRQFLCCEKMMPNATLPKRATNGSAGYDLYAYEKCVIPKGKQKNIRTQIIMAMPPGHCGIIKSRSSLASKHRVNAQAGLIDNDYHGEVIVVLSNDGDYDFKIEPGDRIAQMIIMECYTGDVKEVKSINDIVKRTNRVGGFGSTGK